MTRKIRPATIVEVGYVSSAIVQLGHARQYLKLAGCPESVKAVTRAIKSAEGAYRHVRHRQRATEEAKRCTL